MMSHRKAICSLFYVRLKGTNGIASWPSTKPVKQLKNSNMNYLKLPTNIAGRMFENPDLKGMCGKKNIRNDMMSVREKCPYNL